MTDTVELCLIGAGYISTPITEAPSGHNKGANGSSTQIDAEKQRIAAFNEPSRQREAQWAARRVREKRRALEDGYAWDEKHGYATDQVGKRITLADDGQWEYVEF